MTSEQLRYFITIVDTGSYMDAALELNISQSSVSKQIQALERELGISLFDRSSRKAKLTQEGRELLPEARSVLAKLDHLVYSASKLQPGYSKRLTVATLPFMGYLGLYASLSRFEIENPDYHLTFIEEEEPQLMRRLLTSDFDIIITYEYEYQFSNRMYNFMPITDDEIMLLTHRLHPLAAQETVTLDDIGDSPFLIMESYTCIAKLCSNYFKEHDFVPNVVFHGRPETIFGGVEAQRGVAMLTRKQIRCYTATDSVALPFDPPIPITIGVILNTRKQHQKQMDELVNLLKSNF